MSAFNEAFSKIFGSSQPALKDRSQALTRFKETQVSERKQSHPRPMATRISKPVNEG